MLPIIRPDGVATSVGQLLTAAGFKVPHVDSAARQDDTGSTRRVETSALRSRATLFQERLFPLTSESNQISALGTRKDQLTAPAAKGQRAIGISTKKPYSQVPLSGGMSKQLMVDGDAPFVRAVTRDQSEQLAGLTLAAANPLEQPKHPLIQGQLHHPKIVARLQIKGPQLAVVLTATETCFRDIAEDPKVESVDGQRTVNGTDQPKVTLLAKIRSQMPQTPLDLCDQIRRVRKRRYFDPPIGEFQFQLRHSGIKQLNTGFTRREPFSVLRLSFESLSFLEQNGSMFNDDFSPAEDRSSNEEKLEKYSGEVDWSYLKPHYDAGNMIYVDPSLDLKAAGLAFANDDQTQVKAWLKSGDLVQPCNLHADHWEQSKTQFTAMIVRPFILAQPVS